MKILLFSDLHLDAAFVWAGAEAARNRRRELQTVLDRIVDLAHESGVDAVLCGGDLYEHERFTPDTVEYVRSRFEKLQPIPVYIAPGNHDWMGPGSLYAQAAFSNNVHVFESDRLSAERLADGVTLWGAAHCAPANTDDFLTDFHTGRSGVNLALFHGSESALLHLQGSGKAAHAPFRADEIERAGIDHAFLGHYHSPRDDEGLTYPGNPDPLSFGEDGERGVVLAEVLPSGEVRRERRDVSVGRLHDVEVDVSGCSSAHDVIACVEGRLRGREGLARVTLSGTLERSVDLREDDIRTTGSFGSLRAVAVRFSPQLRIAYDYDALAAEPTVRGQFVRDVREAGLDPEEERAVLVTGLRALDGRDDLEAL